MAQNDIGKIYAEERRTSVNILYDHQIFSAQRYGGISRYFFEIVRRISEKEHVDLFCGYNNNRYGINHAGTYNSCFSKERITSRFGVGRVYNRLNNWSLKSFSKDKHIDVYHPTYYDYYDIPKEKLVVTVYDMIHELFPKYFIHDNTAMRKRELLSKADGIIAISNQTKEDLIKLLGIAEEKISVIYLANSLKLDVCGESIVQNPYILYVGCRAGYKNFTRLLKAFAGSECCKDFKLVCFGGGAFSNLEKTQIDALGVSEAVIQILGDDAVLANLYKHAALFVYPSEYEGFGLPPLEAMHYGTPVICSDVSSIPEVVGNAGVYFNPASVEDIQEKLLYVLSNNECREKLIAYGYEQEKKFSWDSCAEETVDFYRNILK